MYKACFAFNMQKTQPSEMAHKDLILYFYILYSFYIQFHLITDQNGKQGIYGVT